jgi:hypothetical protein
MSEQVAEQTMSAEEIARAGRRIYNDRYLSQMLEANERGKFMVINVGTGEGTLGASPEQALEKAKAIEPNGPFHTIRVGGPVPWYSCNSVRARI